MEITRYLSIARRWAWLLIVGLTLGLLIGYGIAKMETPVYQASTRVIVSRASMQTASGATSSNGMYDFFMSDQILIQTYVELLKSSPIFEQVSQIVNYPVSAGQVSAEQVNETRIISITAEDTDPQRAADIANAVVTALIAQNDELEAGRYKASDESLEIQIRQVEEQIAKYQKDLDNLSVVTVDEQLTEVEKQMQPLQVEITQLQKDIAVLTPAWSSERKEKITELQARLDQIQPLLTLYQQIYTDLKVSGVSENNAGINENTAQLEKTISLYQQIYLNLINTREAIRLARLQNTQSVNQIEPASAPSKPVRPQPTQNALFGGIAGLMLVGGIVFLIEFLDDTIKRPEDIEHVLEIPMIGHIAKIGDEEKKEAQIYVASHPRSHIAEAFRALRTNLEFASVDNPLRTILVTSAEAGDGKSTVSTNLAAIFAQGGKRVMLIDCDLRRPSIHRLIGAHNRFGMTDLYRDNLSLSEVTHQWKEGVISISVITSGALPPNPAELLGSQKTNIILNEILQNVDIIIIDSPPSIVTDAQVLAAKVDGVALVVQPGKTHAGAVRAIRDQLDRAGAHIIGVVFNRIARERGYSYGGYHYYSPYYYQNDKYLTGHDSKFAQHEAEPTETVLKSFIKKISKRGTTQKVEEKTSTEVEPEPLPQQTILKEVLNPAGWQKPAQKGDTAQQEKKTGKGKNTDTRKDSARRSSVRKTTTAQKKSAAKSLGRNITSAPASKILLPNQSLTLPSLVRSVGLSTPPKGIASAGRSSNTLIGTDYKFLIHQASELRSLEYYAAKYKTDVKSIVEVNYKIPAPAWVIPTGLTDVSKLPRFMAYEIKEKRTAAELARALSADLSEIQYYNGIKNAEQILNMNWLIIPQVTFPVFDHAEIPAGSEKHRLDSPIGNEQKFVIHKVSEDDNLHHYAARYKTNLETIITISVIPPLQAGTVAVIPVEQTDVSKLPRFEVYEVTESGRTPESIAQELKVDPHKLNFYNETHPGEKLHAGDWLLIPRSRASALWRSASLGSSATRS